MAGAHSLASVITTASSAQAQHGRGSLSGLVNSGALRAATVGSGGWSSFCTVISELT
jgi:hypothetical protein